MIYNAMVELDCVGLAAPLSAHVLHTSSEKLFCNRQSGEGRLGGAGLCPVVASSMSHPSTHLLFTQPASRLINTLLLHTRTILLKYF